MAPDMPPEAIPVLIPSMIVFGFLLGVRHALEADHVAAVAALSTRTSSLRGLLGLAAGWGTGHTCSILAVGAVAVALGATLPAGSELYLERLVGVVLVAMGLDVLRRLGARRVHVHAHDHGDGRRHVHLHLHESPGSEHEARAPVHGSPAHAHDQGAHSHGHPGLLRALAMGSLHGMAGSAALLVVAIPQGGSALGALACLAAFGVGSIAGMLLFSLALSLPLRFAARGAGMMAGLEGTLGLATLLVGLRIVVG